MVAVLRWFDATENSSEYISSLGSLNLCSIFVELVGGQNNLNTW